jgi:hypothetical protein
MNRMPMSEQIKLMKEPLAPLEWKKSPETKPAARKFVGLDKLKKAAEYAEKEQGKVLELSPEQAPKRILIAIPTNKYIEPECFKSIYDLIIPDGYTVEFQYFYGYAISQVRNLIAHWGLRFDYLFCVDSDVVFESNTLVKMLNSGKNIISGCYVQRLHNNTLELFEANGLGGVKPILTDRLNGKLIQIDACGFGCVLINSQVLRDMKYPWFVYHEALDHKDTISEDIYFAAKAKEAGYTLYADTSIICKHIGAHYYVPVNPNDTLKNV